MFFSADVKADVQGSGKIVTNKKGNQYIQITNVRSKISVGDQAVQFFNKDRNTAVIGKHNASMNSLVLM